MSMCLRTKVIRCMCGGLDDYLWTFENRRAIMSLEDFGNGGVVVWGKPP